MCKILNLGKTQQNQPILSSMLPLILNSSNYQQDFAPIGCQKDCDLHQWSVGKSSIDFGYLDRHGIVGIFIVRKSKAIATSVDTNNRSGQQFEQIELNVDDQFASK